MIYFDNSATTKPYEEVIDAFVKISTQFFANPSSLHDLGGKVEELVKQARNQIAHILQVKANEIFFTSGGTEGNNLAIKGTAIQYSGRGKHIIASNIEHASVYETCEQLKSLGFTITYLPVDQYGQVNPGELEAAITNETILVSIMHVNNEMGTIQPITEIGAILKKYPKILFHVDHVQGFGKVPLDLYKANVDLCTISAHKFHGLKGNGLLYKREGVTISPLLTGGSQEGKLRSGTENTAGIVTMAKAMRMVEEKRKEKGQVLQKIRDYLINNLQQIPQVHIHTNPSVSAPHIINFSAEGLRGEVIVHALEKEKVYVSTTSACSSKQKKLSRTLLSAGIPEKIAEGAVRISLSYENNLEEAKMFIQSLQQVLQKLNMVMRDTK
ncbi:cysteine desulfurase family protein [Bacillus sp. FJAT-49736]|uniref:cysteine desulfurase family protein n=1 Tax=Bacillus sp. FJAT-49736 TaxID=2833582 RepID=UPI001BC95671|nr:cysteine desulfurase family protein [Bacillus sp. FJAT-49736]MBS4173825.1 cysteine desulfurase [Bacillus sp. FJAT-49736]